MHVSVIIRVSRFNMNEEWMEEIKNFEEIFLSK